VAEITKMARKEPVLAAEGAIQFLERVSEALAQVDSSSGAIGSAVNHAVAELAAIIGAAQVDAPTRRDWLERLWLAYVNDQIPYIESLGDHWGEVCASKEIASEWADRLVGGLRENWTTRERNYYKGTPNCLGAMIAAERYGEVMDLLELAPYKMWNHCQFGVKALVAQGKIVEAIRYAEEGRGLNDGWDIVAAVCEDLLLSAGMVEEAYQRYGVSANRAGTYLATFRAVAKKYPRKSAAEILADLVKSTPGDEGKWFAAAKEAGLFDEALALAGRTPCDPRTLTRAARDYAEKQSAFAVGAGLLALHWLVEGYGYLLGDTQGPDLRHLRVCLMADVREVAKERSDGSNGVVSLALGDDERQPCLRQNDQLFGELQHRIVVGDQAVPGTGMPVQRQQELPVGDFG
jgi:hypothetical protein